MRHQPQFPGSARCSPAWYVRVAAAPLADSLFDGRSKMPWSAATCACHRRSHQAQSLESNHVRTRILPCGQMWRCVEAARKYVVLRMYSGRPNPSDDGLTCLLREFKLHRTLGFLLHDYRARSDDTSVTHVPHTQLHQIARSQLAVDGEVEERQLSRAAADLQSYADRPDIFQLQRSFLPHQLALVPRSISQCNMSRLVHDGLPSFVDDQATLRR
jgi:hypothetical protein